MKKLLVIASIMSFLISQDIETHGGTTASGIVPFCASWELCSTTNCSDNAAAFPATAIADYDNGYVQIGNFLQITDLDVNGKFYIEMYRSAWTVPDDYSDDGAKHNSNGISTDSDVKIEITSVAHGYAAETGEGLRAAGAYGSYTAIGDTDNKSKILEGGAIGENEGHGVEDATADISIQFLMDWSTDIEGNYGITTTLVIVDDDS